MSDLADRIFNRAGGVTLQGKVAAAAVTQAIARTSVFLPDGPPECFERLFISPQMAAEWLEQMRYPRQRPLRPMKVEVYRRALMQGSLTPEMIRIAVLPGVPGWHPGIPGWQAQLPGRAYLVDGQHRLSAVVAAGRGVEFPVWWRRLASEQAVDEWYGRIDRGAPRSSRDTLHAHSMGDVTGVGANFTARMSSAMPWIVGNFGPQSERKILQQADDLRMEALVEWREEIHSYYACLSGVGGAYRHSLLRASVASVALVTLRYVPALAPIFWSTVAQRSDLPKGSPEFALSTWLADHSQNRQVDYVARAVAGAWNAAHAGRPLTQIKVLDMRAPIVIAGTPYIGKKRDD